MRDFKGMKRQRGRNNRGGAGSGGKPQQHNANRAFDSNGPEGVKVRGAAQGVYEKYQQLARDATSSGDRVLAENYLQHAEHYFRVLRAIQPNRPVSDIIGKDAYSAYEIDFEAEPEEQPGSPRSDPDRGSGRRRGRRRRPGRQAAATGSRTVPARIAPVTGNATTASATTVPATASATTIRTATATARAAATAGATGTTVPVMIGPATIVLADDRPGKIAARRPSSW